MDVEYTLLLINVYFPFKQNNDEHRVHYLEVLGSIEDIVASNPTAKFIITGDLNYNIYDHGQAMTATVRNFFTHLQPHLYT